MTQHINLLTRRAPGKGLSWYALWGLLVLLLILLVMAGTAEMRLQELRQAQAKAQQSVADLKSVLEKKRHDAGLGEGEAMAKQMALLQSQIDSRREWADLLEKGELGNPLGYSQLLETLAAVHAEGVWLNSVGITANGQSLAIGGKSLSGEAVMRYLGQINEAFKPMGIEFSSIEITQDAAGADAAGSARAGILNFRIN